MQMPEEEKFLSSQGRADRRAADPAGRPRCRAGRLRHSTTTGASNDIERATELARKMVTQYGMSEKLGLMALSTVSNPYLDGSTMMNCADSTSSAADEEIHKLLMGCYEDARQLLVEHRALLDEIALYPAHQGDHHRRRVHDLRERGKQKADGRLRRASGTRRPNRTRLPDAE